MANVKNIKTANVTNQIDNTDDSLTYERFLDVVEQTLFDHYKETWGQERAYQVIDSMGYVDSDRPTFSDSVYIARLNDLNNKTIIA